MTSLSEVSYGERASRHSNPVARRLLQIAEVKRSNLVVSADLTTSAELLKCADGKWTRNRNKDSVAKHIQEIGPYIAILKTHVDIVSDFSKDTVEKLKAVAKKHNFLIFEDRKFVDIGNTVQKQYHGGPLYISEFAEIVNASILSGDGIVEALSQVIHSPDFPYAEERALILLAEMTSKGSLATGSYTSKCIELARRHTDSVIGFIANGNLSSVQVTSSPSETEDLLIFTTGVNQKTKGDKLGQQYQTPTEAIEGGGDFIISGRGIYASPDPVQSAQSYQKEGWDAYLKRVGKAWWSEGSEYSVSG